MERMKILNLFVIFSSFLGSSHAQELEDYSQEFSGSGLEIEMIAIPEGVFRMGSPPEERKRREDEGPVHQVKLEAFWISKYEITWELYNRYITSINKGTSTAGSIGKENLSVDAISGATVPYVDMSLGMGTGPGLPVGNVTPLAASRFCEWLSAKTGHFYRLPTEAEWEYAARAGTETSYFFGDDPSLLEEYAWFYGNSNGSYHEIGQKKPNPWGLYDIYGNVAEWTLDQYHSETYSQRETVSEMPFIKPLREYPRIARGGSYYHDPADLRSSARLQSTENWKMRDPQFPKSKWWNTDAPFVGFRIVRVPNPPALPERQEYWK